MAGWHKKWKELYKRDTQSFEPFYLWLRYTKGWSQIEILELDLDDDETFLLLEEYGNDQVITRLSEECQEETGI